MRCTYIRTPPTHIPNSTQSQIDPKTPIAPQPGLMPRRQRLRPLLLLLLLRPRWMAAAPAPAPLAAPAAAGHDRPLAGSVGSGLVAFAPRHDGFGLQQRWPRLQQSHPSLATLPFSLFHYWWIWGDRGINRIESNQARPSNHCTTARRLAMAPLQASSLRRPNVHTPRLRALIRALVGCMACVPTLLAWLNGL